MEQQEDRSFFEIERNNLDSSSSKLTCSKQLHVEEVFGANMLKLEKLARKTPEQALKPLAAKTPEPLAKSEKNEMNLFHLDSIEEDVELYLRQPHRLKVIEMDRSDGKRSNTNS